MPTPSIQDLIGEAIAGGLATFGLLALATLPLSPTPVPVIIGALIFLGLATGVLILVGRQGGLVMRDTLLNMVIGGLATLWAAVILLSLGHPHLLVTVIVATLIFGLPAGLIEYARTRHGGHQPRGHAA